VATEPRSVRVELQWIAGEYAICRLPPDSRLGNLATGPFLSVTRTGDELSVVCLASEAPDDARCERGYELLRVAGSMDLGLTGVLASLTAPLAAAGIPIFAVATFDTDYLLIRGADHERAAAALVAAGHRFVTG